MVEGALASNPPIITLSEAVTAICLLCMCHPFLISKALTLSTLFHQNHLTRYTKLQTSTIKLLIVYYGLPRKKLKMCTSWMRMIHSHLNHDYPR